MSKFTSHLDKALGLDGAAKLLADKGINALNEEFRKRGEQAKQNKATDSGAQAAQDEQKDWEPLLTEVLTGADAHQQAIDDADTAHKQYVTATDKRIKALEETNEKLLKRLDSAESALKAIQSDTPRRASEASETKLGDEDEQKAKEAIRQRTAVSSPVFGDLFNGKD